MFGEQLINVKFHIYDSKDDREPIRRKEWNVAHIPTQYVQDSDDKYEIFESCLHFGQMGGNDYYVLKVVKVDDE